MTTAETSRESTPPGFWKVLRLLLGAARKRSTGRRRRQRELLNQRSGRTATDWGGLGFLFTILLMLLIHGMAAGVVLIAVKSAERSQIEADGKIAVSREFIAQIAIYGSEAEFREPGHIHSIDPDGAPPQILMMFGDQSPPIEALPAVYEMVVKSLIARESKEIDGSRSDEKAFAEKLWVSIRDHGARDLIPRDELPRGLEDIAKSGRFPALVGSALLLIWGAMLVFQGEGLELDIQRRRHPMWEWLFSHPIPPGAIFLAEMLSPLAANPIYWTAPIFPAILFGTAYGPGIGLLAAVLVGVPIAIAAGCLGKALEIATILRLAPRSRGAVVGLMSWFGYATMMLFLIGIAAVPGAVAFLGSLHSLVDLLTSIPWPWLGFFLGAQSDGHFSFQLALASCWLCAALITAAAVSFSVWGAKQGLAGNFAADSRPAAPKSGATRFGREPLYRKELLWFLRDRSAIVQVILIPITVAGYQIFNLRRILAHAQSAWYGLCGTAIVFGTYFLWVLGPKSLASEGSALWIALTWPRGLESLLKAKAWLWSMIATGLVSLILLFAAISFPADIWKIALLGIGWFFFARSMAEKSVTLVTIMSESGEVQKIPSGRRWATTLGMLTFATGVLTQQWHIAVMGIVYSYITAAAMWQNFRARLPYLYDPWSEKIPPAPTLMHAMIAISILVEAGAVVTALLTLVVGHDHIPVATALAYGICAVIVSIGTASFLSDREVSSREIWSWKPLAEPSEDFDGEEAPAWWRTLPSRAVKIAPALAAALGLGIALGLLARGYALLLAHIPATQQMVQKTHDEFARSPELHISYAIMAVLFAPFAEEYLFRGLLFRALDKEWAQPQSNWRAVFGSAAFFAIYHPALAWPPVFLLGAANCLLFKKSGKLAPAVLLHMIYNLVVVA